MNSGVEWLVEAFGCAESKLKDAGTLAALFDEIVAEMDLRPIGDALWHEFPHTGGITGMWMLAESHLTIHSFPELGSACLNLFCCRERPAIDWSARLRSRLGARSVRTRELARPYASEPS